MDSSRPPRPQRVRKMGALRLNAALIGLTGLSALTSAHQATAADLVLGAYLAGECVGCHKLSGEAVSGIPEISGLPEAEHIAALTAYKTGERPNPVMRTIAARLSAEEIAAVAAFFAAQKH